MEHTCIEHENTLVWSKWGGVEIPAARIVVRYAGARVGVVQNMDIDNMDWFRLTSFLCTKLRHIYSSSVIL
jgi:hypothetical protein